MAAYQCKQEIDRVRLDDLIFYAFVQHIEIGFERVCHFLRSNNGERKGDALNCSTNLNSSLFSNAQYREARHCSLSVSLNVFCPLACSNI